MISYSISKIAKVLKKISGGKVMKKYWVLIAIVVAFVIMWLFFKNNPTYVVKENKELFTMQEYLQKNGEVVSFADFVRSDAPWRNVFRWIVKIDRTGFNSEKYKLDHPENGIWCVGTRLEETRCYIFTNKTPPQELREFYRYIE